MIPRRVYDAVEARLYQRRTLVARAAEKLLQVRQKASSVGVKIPEALPPKIQKRRGANPAAIHGKGATSDPTESAAFAIIQAEAALCTALKWEEVFSRLDEIFAGKPEAEIAEAIYQQRRQQKDVAVLMHYDRQSIRRYRDTYVCHCALLAAEKGLIKIQEGDEDNER